ncbi:hypothetical protein N7509_007262 [Penicillium cosmopolitanum]|uniref:Uncharacterized protein n=1 Tax=Penicillium cosmopolitanum TaxID=1131564 RepID=A0A9W9VYN6_9EURO|nr:uncharacterized protein N7509_007262 [Penicillium cosmopolitanum]KAJ5391772.1 hypothetical protein N7509_007262 [Penicillium cosmopolitanum]
MLQACRSAGLQARESETDHRERRRRLVALAHRTKRLQINRHSLGSSLSLSPVDPLGMLALASWHGENPTA